MRTYRTVCGAIAAAISFCLLSAGCSSSQPSATATAGDTTCDGTIQGPGPTYITVWFHTGQPSEKQTMGQQVAAFNASQKQVQVKLIDIPEAGYAAQVRAAAATGNLPDLLDFDGPDLYNYAWSGKLKPLDSCVNGTAGLRTDLLPSIVQQGTYAGRLYGLGTFDSGLGLYVRPSVLRKIGVRIPTGVGDAWTAAEFTAILHKLHNAGYRQPLDLQVTPTTLASAPEWWSYGFAPVVWSAGGDLINRSTYRTAQGVLNSPASVQALTVMQSWFRDGLVNPNVPTSFVTGQAPISWVGHWMYGPFSKAFPHDLEIVPLPRFGAQPSSGMGSWQWGITSNATDGDAVWRFLDYLLQPAQVLKMSQANGSIPATRSAIRLSPNFAPGGPEHIYVQQLEGGIARPRPQTPAYPAISLAFATALARISKGEDVRQALNTAVRQIDANLAANRYYPPSSP
jgi:multiple sugar transport system substrate-binding protein